MDKIKIAVVNPDTGETPSNEELLQAAEEAGWSEDPGTGKAILIADERGAPAYEVFNPLPMAPPIGWTPTPPIEELIAQRVQLELGRLKDDEEIDDIIDAEDFDVPDDLPPLETIYEFIGMEPQAPQMKEPNLEDRAKAEVAYEEILENHRKLARKRSREEYDRRVKEAADMYGVPPPKPDIIRPKDEEEGA